MSSFKQGLFWGAIFGGIAGLMNAKQEGHKTRQELAGYINQASQDIDDIRFKFENLNLAIQRLTHEGQKVVEETSQELQTTLKHFQEENQPRLRRVQDKVETLTQNIEEQSQAIQASLPQSKSEDEE
ncbi:YtxH domain-containing protein [Eremococcus coleocola]|uniref:YtxH domain-containing protein n=1 Tax=Eremococcus coleocola ACS-139-V-Col8 TaxID=908337 RepID=E4KQ78_9LACT|nr:YtxH domain-containing protein [Eremococcus coleocola]EFR30832.1 hypothetical protein HMPREF9257_1678 [Eremococcus coleocola ACS-139-V-Col8]